MMQYFVTELKQLNLVDMNISTSRNEQSHKICLFSWYIVVNFKIEIRVACIVEIYERWKNKKTYRE